MTTTNTRHRYTNASLCTYMQTFRLQGVGEVTKKRPQSVEEVGPRLPGNAKKPRAGGREADGNTLMAMWAVPQRLHQLLTVSCGVPGLFLPTALSSEPRGCPFVFLPSSNMPLSKEPSTYGFHLIQALGSYPPSSTQIPRNIVRAIAGSFAADAGWSVRTMLSAPVVAGNPQVSRRCRGKKRVARLGLQTKNLALQACHS